MLIPRASCGAGGPQATPGRRHGAAPGGRSPPSPAAWRLRAAASCPCLTPAWAATPRHARAGLRPTRGRRFARNQPSSHLCGRRRGRRRPRARRRSTRSPRSRLAPARGSRSPPPGARGTPATSAPVRSRTATPTPRARPCHGSSKTSSPFARGSGAWPASASSTAASGVALTAPSSSAPAGRGADHAVAADQRAQLVLAPGPRCRPGASAARGSAPRRSSRRRAPRRRRRARAPNSRSTARGSATARAR